MRFIKPNASVWVANTFVSGFLLPFTKRDAHLTERNGSDTRYTYHNRAYHATILRYAFESLAQAQDLRPNAVPQSYGRKSVVNLDILRPQNTSSYPIDAYETHTEPMIPRHLIPRFKSFFTRYKTTNGTYTGSDKQEVTPIQIKEEMMRG